VTGPSQTATCWSRCPTDEQTSGGVIGHRQVTDADLIALAAEHGERLATLDRGLAALHGDKVILLTEAQR
jgi:predicted nucleic acid-binding protein